MCSRSSIGKRRKAGLVAQVYDAGRRGACKRKVTHLNALSGDADCETSWRRQTLRVTVSPSTLISNVQKPTIRDSPSSRTRRTIHSQTQGTNPALRLLVHTLRCSRTYPLACPSLQLLSAVPCAEAVGAQRPAASRWAIRLSDSSRTSLGFGRNSRDAPPLGARSELARGLRASQVGVGQAQGQTLKGATSPVWTHASYG